jgi:hypothetical protein
MAEIAIVSLFFGILGYALITVFMPHQGILAYIFVPFHHLGLYAEIIAGSCWFCGAYLLVYLGSVFKERVAYRLPHRHWHVLINTYSVSILVLTSVMAFQGMFFWIAAATLYDMRSLPAAILGSAGLLVYAYFGIRFLRLLFWEELR